MGAADPNDLTLTFEVAALERLADPTAALADAATWSVYIGIATDGTDPDATIGAWDAEVDFVGRTLAGVLAEARQRLQTGRHVLVGADETQRLFARSLGAEFRTIEDAAARAGWSLRQRH
jgi:hypothetical protein